MGVVTKVKGAEEAARKIGLIGRAVRKSMVESIDYATVRTANQAKVDHPYIDRTENLTNSIGVKSARQTLNEITGSAQAGMIYSAPVERSHPYMMPALRDTWPGTVKFIGGNIKHAIAQVMR